MVIYFKDEKARRYLLEHGEVFSLRLRRKRFGVDVAKRDAKSPPFARVVVEDWGEIDTQYPFRLLTYVGKSGYLDVIEWLRAVKKLNNLKKLPKTLQLIRVVKI